MKLTREQWKILYGLAIQAIHEEMARTNVSDANAEWTARWNSLIGPPVMPAPRRDPLSRRYSTTVRLEMLTEIVELIGSLGRKAEKEGVESSEAKPIEDDLLAQSFNLSRDLLAQLIAACPNVPGNTLKEPWLRVNSMRSVIANALTCSKLSPGVTLTAMPGLSAERMTQPAAKSLKPVKPVKTGKFKLGKGPKHG